MMLGTFRKVKHETYLYCSYPVTYLTSYNWRLAKTILYTLKIMETDVIYGYTHTYIGTLVYLCVSYSLHFNAFLNLPLIRAEGN